jgi:hypothetical protein
MELKPDEAQDRRVQDTYARWLDGVAKAGFAATLAALLVYLSGALPPFVALADLPALWRLPVAQYLEATGAPTGWAWLRLLGKGDYLSLLAVASFAAASLLCCLRILPVLLSHRDRTYAFIAAAQAAVLLLAASGILNRYL